MPALDQLIGEAQRMLAICNACRYCEGYCAVFPALERRLEFGEDEIHYLANLCHNCGSCLYACQYAPPHEFQLNFPRLLAEVRAETYRKYAWPAALGGLFQRNGVAALFAGHYHRNASGKAGQIQMITTGPVGMPLGDDPSGMRLVKVTDQAIEQKYYGLGNLPNSLNPSDSSQTR